jgi:hypothetical protein
VDYYRLRPIPLHHYSLIDRLVLEVCTLTSHSQGGGAGSVLNLQTGSAG